LHTGLATANPAILAISLTVGAHWAASKQNEKLAGILLSLAICLKPTVAGGLLLYYLLRRKWKIALVTTGLVMVIAAVGASRLALSHVSWVPSYLENTRRIFSIGSVDDFTSADRLRFDMINAQVAAASLVRSATTANLLSRILGAGLFLVWFLRCYRRRTPSGFLEISAIFVCSLICVYHRFYDAALLIWPLAWSLLLVKRRSLIALVLVCTAPFFVPGPAILAELARSGQVPAAVMHHWWWEKIILPHEAWFLVLLAGLLLYCMGREPDENQSTASIDLT
jgi:hypothetical protein